MLCRASEWDSLTIWPVVWKASSTMLSSWSDAARWKTEKIFFQPERMFEAWEFTIWAIHRTTMSLIVGDLVEQSTQALFGTNCFQSWELSYLLGTYEWETTLLVHRRTAQVNLMDTLCCRVLMTACQSVGGFNLALLLFYMNYRVAVFWCVAHKRS